MKADPAFSVKTGTSLEACLPFARLTRSLGLYAFRGVWGYASGRALVRAWPLRSGVHGCFGIELAGWLQLRISFRLSIVDAFARCASSPIPTPPLRCLRFRRSRSMPMARGDPNGYRERLILSLEPASGRPALRAANDAGRLFAGAPSPEAAEGCLCAPGTRTALQLAKVRVRSRSPSAGRRPTRCRPATRRASSPRRQASAREALIERNELAPTRLKVGQVLYLPKGGKAPVAPRAVAVNTTSLLRAKSAPDVHVVKTTHVSGARHKPQSAPAPASSPTRSSAGRTRKWQAPSSCRRRSPCRATVSAGRCRAHHLRVRHQA